MPERRQQYSQSSAGQLRTLSRSQVADKQVSKPCYFLCPFLLNNYTVKVPCIRWIINTASANHEIFDHITVLVANNIRTVHATHTSTIYAPLTQNDRR